MPIFGFKTVWTVLDGPADDLGFGISQTIQKTKLENTYPPTSLPPYVHTCVYKLTVLFLNLYLIYKVMQCVHVYLNIDQHMN